MNTPCKLYTGSIDPTNGYGYRWVYVGGKRKVYAHREAYEEHVGPIPEGYQVDHLCGVRACIEPTHLEAVTAEENKRRVGARSTQCRRGHPRTVEHVRINKNGKRVCRTCEHDYNQRYNARKRVAA